MSTSAELTECQGAEPEESGRGQEKDGLRRKTLQAVAWDLCFNASMFSPPEQQLDLQTVKDMYLEKYDVTLKDALDSECGGDFKRLLIAILH